MEVNQSYYHWAWLVKVTGSWKIPSIFDLFKLEFYTPPHLVTTYEWYADEVFYCVGRRLQNLSYFLFVLFA